MEEVTEGINKIVETVPEDLDEMNHIIKNFYNENKQFNLNLILKIKFKTTIKSNNQFKKPKYIIYHCDTSCSGFADRVKGRINVLIF